MLRIREHAFHIWAANGGDADQNWLRAETEISTFQLLNPVLSENSIRPELA